jgi:tripartite ATP-independent transporter DctM subunit
MAAIGIIILVILLFMGMNIGLAMMIVGFAGFACVKGLSATIGIIGSDSTAQAASYNLSVIPLFILMGNLAFGAGLSQGLYKAANSWLSRLPGGLACATIAACAGFGAICGSVIATAATMGVVSIPEMRKYGYDDSLSTGAIAVGGTLGILIPPSTPFIIYGILTECSINQLFAAGVFPGLLLASFCILVVVIQVKRKPSMAPSVGVVTWKERFASLKGLIGISALFIFTIGGMFLGVFTVNEAAAIGVTMAILLTLISRRFHFRSFFEALRDSVLTTAMSFLILIGAAVFGSFLTITRMPMTLAAFISDLNVSRYVIFAIIVLIYAFLGCIMDGLPMMMLTVPIFLPVLTALNFDPIWFGVIIVLVMELGAITPPVGMSCYVIAGVAKDVPLPTIFKGSFPYVPAVLLAIVIVTVFPQTALWLPSVVHV